MIRRKIDPGIQKQIRNSKNYEIVISQYFFRKRALFLEKKRLRFSNKMILGRNREILKHLIAISGSGLCVGNDEADRRGSGGGQEEERSKWLGEEK